MSNTNHDISTVSDSGSINYANDVIAKIAALAADEIEGVVGMTGGSLSDMLGMKNLTKGIKVTLADRVATIDLSMIVEYGSKIHEVCKNVQANVKKAIENMTGLDVGAVNVNVQGIHIEKEKEEVKDEE